MNNKSMGSGIALVTMSTAFTRIFSVISAVILSRILLPDDFGLLSIALSFVNIIQGFTISGFDSAIIQRKIISDKILNVAWTIDLMKYLFLYVLIFMIAPTFSLFFHDQRLVDIIRIISLSVILQGFRNIGVVLYRKQGNFKLFSIFELIPALSNALLVVIFVLYLKSFWAVILASILSNVIMCIASYIMHPYRPKLVFDKEIANELFNFGKWILGNSVVNMVKDQGITMYIAKILGITTLGYYNRATIFSVQLFNQTSTILWKVAYPQFACMQDDKMRLTEKFKLVFLNILLFSFPISTSLFIFAEDFVLLFLTEKWMNIIPLLKLFSFLGLLIMIHSPISLVLQSCGKPSIPAKSAIYEVVTLLTIIYPLTLNYGINGIIISLLLSMIVNVFVLFIQIKSELDIKYNEIIKMLLTFIMSSIAMVLSVNVIGYFFNISLLLSCLIRFIVGLATFFTCIYIVNIKARYQIVKFAKIIKTHLTI